jgi:hypothetical protein
MSVALGIILAVAGGASLALAMVTQRYALDQQNQTVPGKVPLFGVQYNSTAVWFFGLILYGGANGLYAMALLYGPLSLLAGCFTTLLIFNLIFARCLLGEKVSPPKVVGSIVILGGVVASIVATPRGVDTEFTPKDVEDLVARPIGAIYCALLFFSVLASVALITWYEKAYPLLPPEHSEDSGKDTDTILSPASPPASPPVLPPVWLDRVMTVVYPGSLGMDEGICHLTMKACVSMLDTCGKAGECGRPTMWVFMVVWVGGSVATLWWLRRVFTRFVTYNTWKRAEDAPLTLSHSFLSYVFVSWNPPPPLSLKPLLLALSLKCRYETTRALPVEYGAVNAVSACSGLVFYREHTFMKPWQLTTMCAGVAAILVGIAIGNSAPLEDTRYSAAGSEGGQSKKLELSAIAPVAKKAAGGSEKAKGSPF